MYHPQQRRHLQQGTARIAAARICPLLAPTPIPEQHQRTPLRRPPHLTRRPLPSLPCLPYKDSIPLPPPPDYVLLSSLYVLGSSALGVWHHLRTYCPRPLGTFPSASDSHTTLRSAISTPPLQAKSGQLRPPSMVFHTTPTLQARLIVSRLRGRTCYCPVQGPSRGRPRSSGAPPAPSHA